MANWVLVWTIAIAFVAALLGVIAPPAAAQNCARTGAFTPGDWTVTDAQVCDGITIVMDGNLIIAGPAGALTIRNGGLKFVEDTSHIYGITVGAGRSLTFDHSRVWTEANLLNPYLKLTVSVSGTLSMLNSTLAFPGTLTTNAGATATFTNSTITQTDALLSVVFGNAIEEDENNDAPGLTFAGSIVQVFNSRFEHLYENGSLSGPDPRTSIRLQAGTTFTAANSFLAVDFNGAVATHNTLALTGNSNAYLYSVTFDLSENPSIQADLVNAITTEAGSRADIYRRADVRVVDFNHIPVPNADLNADFAGPETGCASFRETGSCVPPLWILNYLGKTPTSWDDTGSNGMAHFPLLSEWIDSTTFPNSRFVGSFNLVATAQGGQQGDSTLTFDSYPSMGDPDVNKSASIQIVTLVLPFPELTIASGGLAFNGDNGNGVDSQPINRQLTIAATVSNTGQAVSTNVIVNFYSTDVDSDRDGFMDQPHSFYVAAGFFIGADIPRNIAPLGSQLFTRTWTPLGTAESAPTVSAVADPSTGSDPRAGGTVPELNESNNVATRTVILFTWPDLHFAADPVTGTSPASPIVNNNVTISLTLTNEGTQTATQARVGIYNATTDVLIPGTEVTVTVPRAGSISVDVVWVPATAAPTTIRFRVVAAGAVSPSPNFRNYDFDLSDNFANKQFTVLSQPALSVAMRGALPSPYRQAPFTLNLWVNNTGNTTATNIVVGVVDQDRPGGLIGAIYGLNVPQANLAVTVDVSGMPTSGFHNLTVMVDQNRTVTEVNEANNVIVLRINVIPPPGAIHLINPTAGMTFAPGDQISVYGKVLQNDGSPIGDVGVAAYLRDSAGNEVAGTRIQGLSGSDGVFLLAVNVPSNVGEGAYDLVVVANQGSVGGDQHQLSIQTNKGPLGGSFLGLPVWIWLIVIVGAAAAIGGGTAYVKFVGLGKLVECGECGAFIPEDSNKCPKCGVEFEKDMAKCSNCQAWIPVNVKQCPECGVEFATGEVEMADYEAQMRRQYDDVKRKLREESTRELGRTLSDREFEDWWRTQPTFVTFEEWLKEEEDMRRMGSKPCPTCSTLNSVTATVCHKCGTLLKEDTRRRGGGGGGPPPAVRPVTAGPSAGAGEEEMGGPSEAIPKKVVKKPVVGAPVVQKKVIKRPLDEQKEGEGGTEGGDEEPM